MNERIELLKKLRAKLESIDASDFDKIRAWVAEATPGVRQDWPMFLADFQSSAAEPKWVQSVGFGGSPEADAAYQKSKLQVQATNTAIAVATKQKILSTLDGILSATATSSEPTVPLQTVELLCRRSRCSLVSCPNGAATAVPSKSTTNTTFNISCTDFFASILTKCWTKSGPRRMLAAVPGWISSSIGAYCRRNEDDTHFAA